MPLRRLGRKAGESFRAVGALSTVGLAFVMAIVIGAWVGSVLDRWFGTKPVLFIVFFFFGLAAGILNVYRTVSSALGSSSGSPPRPTSPSATEQVPGERDEGTRSGPETDEDGR